MTAGSVATAKNANGGLINVPGGTRDTGLGKLEKPYAAEFWEATTSFPCLPSLLSS